MDAIKKAVERQQVEAKEPTVVRAVDTPPHLVDAKANIHGNDLTPQTTFDRVKRIRRVLASTK